MREPPYQQNISDMAQGITPACAGTTFPRKPRLAVDWDHPRVCGNHDAVYPHKYLQLGSPPRVREPLGLCTCSQLDLGITPACAGTTALYGRIIYEH